MLKPADLLCPYLSYAGPVATCAVHDEPWFVRTACHGNPGRDLHPRAAGSAACGLGTLVLSTPSLRVELRRAPWAALGVLEDLGPWDPDGKSRDGPAMRVRSPAGSSPAPAGDHLLRRASRGGAAMAESLDARWARRTT